MRTCRVKPDQHQCASCLSVADFCDAIPPCATCSHKSKVYELVEFGHSYKFGPYAIVIYDGKPDLVELDRIYDIKTVKEKSNEANG